MCVSETHSISMCLCLLPTAGFFTLAEGNVMALFGESEDTVGTLAAVTSYYSLQLVRNPRTLSAPISGRVRPETKV